MSRTRIARLHEWLQTDTAIPLVNELHTSDCENVRYSGTGYLAIRREYRQRSLGHDTEIMPVNCEFAILRS